MKEKIIINDMHYCDACRNPICNHTQQEISELKKQVEEKDFEIGVCKRELDRRQMLIDEHEHYADRLNRECDGAQAKLEKAEKLIYEFASLGIMEEKLKQWEEQKGGKDADNTHA